MDFNTMFQDFLERNDIAITAIARKMGYKIVGESTMRMWSYGRPAEKRTAKKFIVWLADNYPHEDIDAWYASLEADKAA